jgi:hypothetical protein
MREKRYLGLILHPSLNVGFGVREAKKNFGFGINTGWHKKYRGTSYNIEKYGKTNLFLLPLCSIC